MKLATGTAAATWTPSDLTQKMMTWTMAGVTMTSRTTNARK